MLTKVGCAPTYQEKIIIFPSQPTLLNSEVPEMPWWNTIGHLKEDLPSRWPQSLQRGIFPAFCWWKNSRPQRIATPLQFDHPWLLIFPPLSKKPGKMGLSLRTFPPKVFSDNCFIDITGKDMTFLFTTPCTSSYGVPKTTASQNTSTASNKRITNDRRAKTHERFYNRGPQA